MQRRQEPKRGRGRPRKETETPLSNTSSDAPKNSDKSKKNSTFSKAEPRSSKLLLYLQGSDTETDSDSGDNGFVEDAYRTSERRITPLSETVEQIGGHLSETADDAGVDTGVKADAKMGLQNQSSDYDDSSEYEYVYVTDTDEDSEDDITEIDYSQFNTKNQEVLYLLRLIRQRDVMIKRLRETAEAKPKKQSFAFNLRGLSKTNTVEYHCTLMDADSGKEFEPCPNDHDCWWCDHAFDWVPVFIPQKYRDNAYYVFGNFCSFNCALRYNTELKDHRVNTRRALLMNLKDKCLGQNVQIRTAGNREILKSKGGPMDIDEYRAAFATITPEMDIPPQIPLVHVIKS